MRTNRNKLSTSLINESREAGPSKPTKASRNAGTSRPSKKSKPTKADASKNPPSIISISSEQDDVKQDRYHVARHLFSAAGGKSLVHD